MTTSNHYHTYAQLLKVVGALTVTAPGSPYFGNCIELLGRREDADQTTLLLVRQEQAPHLIEIPAADTNIHEIEIIEGEPQKLVVQQLLKTAAIVAAAEKRPLSPGMGEEMEESCPN